MRCREKLAAFDTAFAEASLARPNDLSVASYAFGGRSLRVRAVGRELAIALGRPLLAISEVDAPPALQLDVWDETSGVQPPRLTPARDLGEAHDSNGERLAVSADGTHARFFGPDFEFWLDRAGHRVVGWIRSIDSLLPWHRYRPLQALLAYWLAGSGVRVIHASAVARRGAAVLLAGRNGVGKSTCAMACLASGMEILGDDVVGVGSADHEVYTLYTVVKTRTPPGSMDRSVARMKDPEGRPEWVTFLNEAAPGQLRRSASIVALAFPRLSAERTGSVTTMRAGEAMKGLLLTDQMGNAGTFAGSFEDWGRLVDEVPAYRLDVGLDPTGLGAIISALTEASNDDAAASR